MNFLEKASKNRVPVAYAVRGFFRGTPLKTQNSVGLNRRTFQNANDTSVRKYSVNFCEKGSKKCVLAAYHMRDFFVGVQTGNAGAEM